MKQMILTERNNFTVQLEIGGIRVEASGTTKKEVIYKAKSTLVKEINDNCAERQKKKTFFKINKEKSMISKQLVKVDNYPSTPAIGSCSVAMENSYQLMPCLLYTSPSPRD